MNSNKKTSTRLVKLAAASEATKGPWGHFSDEVLMRNTPGLSND